MMYRFTLVLVVFAASPCRAELPKLYTEKEFTCITLAEAANHYIALGEKAGIEALEAHSADWKSDFKDGIGRNERVGWICRIVFEPKGKAPLRGPWYGGPYLPWLSMPLEKWPLCPVAVSGRSYFVLGEGYTLSGQPEDPHKYFKYCRAEGKFRKERLPIPSKAQALADLKALRASDAWQAIKWTDSGEGLRYIMSEERTWEFIKAQAAKTPE